MEVQNNSEESVPLKMCRTNKDTRAFKMDICWLRAFTQALVRDATSCKTKKIILLHLFKVKNHQTPKDLMCSILRDHKERNADTDLNAGGII